MGLEQDQAWAESCLFLQGARYVWNLTGLQQASADASVTHLMGNHPPPASRHLTPRAGSPSHQPLLASPHPLFLRSL